MKKIVFVFLIILAINLFMISQVQGIKKELSVSIQVVEGNTSDKSGNVGSHIGELGTLRGSIGDEIANSNNQNVIQRIFSNGIRGELLSVKVEKNYIIFIFSFLAIFLFIIYIIFLALKIKRVVKKRKVRKKKHY